MKAGFFLFLFSMLSSLSLCAQANTSDTTDLADYCYKPSKPLFFATMHYKKRYAEDVEEYQRCRQHFLEMQEDLAEMKTESEKNSQKIWDNFTEQQQFVGWD